jgi:Ser/Thr protein kinase RdoA (MazF antagonist)
MELNSPDQLGAYHALSPDEVLNALESVGYFCDGRLLALNSFENRVYQVGLEDSSAGAKQVVVKFYRPERWTDEAILEEHEFSIALSQLEVPVVPPLSFDGETLLHFDQFRFAVFECRGGRAPDLENLDQLEQMGRFMGRIHQLGKQKPFDHRPTLNIETFGKSARDYVLANGFIPDSLLEAYDSLTEQLIKEIGFCYQRAGEVALIRTHGDAHPGNILWTDAGPHFVDFDDARSAPAVQDLWMFLSGNRADMTLALDALLEGYTQFSDFNPLELHLVEALRTLRLIHYYAWLAKRWDDSAFHRAFPWFNTQNCWESHILSLREQAAKLHEEPLVWL